MSNKHTTSMASLVSMPAHRILLIWILMVEPRTTAVHWMMTLKSLRTLPGRLCLRQWILPGLGLWILKRLFTVLLFTTQIPPCSTAHATMAWSWSPSSQMPLTLALSKLMMLNMQTIPSEMPSFFPSPRNFTMQVATATIESLHNQNSMLQLWIHETDWACDWAELKLEMFEMRTHHPPPICHSCAHHSASTKQDIQCVNGKVRCEEKFSEGGSHTYWVTDPSSSDEKENLAPDGFLDNDSPPQHMYIPCCHYHPSHPHHHQSPLSALSSYKLCTVPFRLIRPSRVTRPVVLAEFGHLSRVTTPMAEDFWRIQKTVKKGFLNSIYSCGLY